jgi:hypothetical protein
MKVRIAPHQAYFPDLLPSDFILFGHIRQKFAGREFNNIKDLIAAIREGFPFISRSVLENVFDEWMTRPSLASAIRVPIFPRLKSRYIYFLDNLRAGQYMK